MKIFSFYLLFFFSSIAAAPSGNPFDPGLIREGLIISDRSCCNFRLAASNSHLMKKKLTSSRPKGASSPKLKDETYGGSFILNLYDCFDAFITAGFIDLDNSFATTEKIRNKKSSYYTDIGANVALIKVKNTVFGGSIHYLLSPAFSYQEWQISAGIAQRLGWFVPYFAITFDGTKIKVVNNNVRRKFTNKETIGIAVGFSILIRALSIEVEGRFIDETALSSKLMLRF